MVAQTATQKKELASAWPTSVAASPDSAITSTTRRPRTSDSQPATADETPHAVAVREMRLATSAMLTERSRPMSIRKGARVVPLEVQANMPSEAAPIRAQGRAASTLGFTGQPPAVPTRARSSRSRGSIAA